VDGAELKALHQALSDEMKKETAALVALEEPPVEPERRPREAPGGTAASARGS